MLDSNYLTVLSLGFVLGLRHALDSDHIAAISTVLAQRPSWRASSLIGFSWGLGHTLVLLLVGAMVLAAGIPIPQPLAIAAESVVGIMLVLLGGLLGIRMIRERWHVHSHDHDGQIHIHLHSHSSAPDHEHSHWWRESITPLCIGMAHGMAGSAALLFVVLSSSHSVIQGLVYIAIFGVGSIVGMMLIGVALSLPMVWSLSLGRPVLLAVQGLASFASIGLGCSILVRIALGEPLL